MKVLVALSVLSIIAFVNSTPLQSGCIYDPWGRCISACEEGTYSYSTGCGHLTPEATCDNPNPVADTRGLICDYSACYCNPPTVRNTVTRKCVKLEKCPPKKKE